MNRHTPSLRALRVASPTPSPGATPAARRSRFRGVPGKVRPFVLPLLLLALFEWYARRAAALGSDALAPPSAAAKAFVGAAMDGSLWLATGFTLGTAALGLLLGAVLGIALGLVLGLSRRAAQLGSVSIEVLRPVPSVALIPLAMLGFGFGVRMELAIVAFATFWPLLVVRMPKSTCASSSSVKCEPSVVERTKLVWLTESCPLPGVPNSTPTSNLGCP